MADYLIVVPVWGSFSIAEQLKPHAHRIVFLTIKRNSPELEAQFSAFSKLGSRVLRFDFTPLSADHGKFTLLKKFLDVYRDEEEFIVFLDADSYFAGNVGSVCEALRRSGYDVATVRVVPDANSNLLEKLQKVEYGVGMAFRRIFSWMTSACFVARTDALRRIMQRHSLHSYGGDIEVGMTAKKEGMRCTYIPFPVFTKVPRDVRAFASQREVWWAGSFRNYVLGLKSIITHFPFFFIYVTLFVYVLFPMRVVCPFVLPQWFLASFVVSLVLSACLYGRFQKEVLIFPLYVFINLLVFPVVGIKKFLCCRLRWR